MNPFNFGFKSPHENLPKGDGELLAGVEVRNRVVALAAQRVREVAHMNGVPEQKPPVGDIYDSGYAASSLTQQPEAVSGATIPDNLLATASQFGSGDTPVDGATAQLTMAEQARRAIEDARQDQGAL